MKTLIMRMDDLHIFMMPDEHEKVYRIVAVRTAMFFSVSVDFVLWA